MVFIFVGGALGNGWLGWWVCGVVVGEVLSLGCLCCPLLQPGGLRPLGTDGDTAKEKLLEQISYTVTDDYKIYLSFCLWFRS